MTHEEGYCDQGVHVRDPLTGECEYCGDSKPFHEAHKELVANEPPRGSVVMTEGPTGTAWQRFHNDGRWHSTSGKSAPWHRLVLNDRPAGRLFVLYLPPLEVVR